MKKLILLLMAISLLALAAPALAQDCNLTFDVTVDKTVTIDKFAQIDKFFEFDVVA
jgi:hypothetical protein